MSGTVEPRGVRNCNPGNIRTGQAWVGLAPMQTDPEFAQFIDAEHGIRALGMTLLTYQDVHGLRTLRGIINRWAPPADRNDTDAYLSAVCGHADCGPDEPLELRMGDLAPVAAAIIAQECGNYIYPLDVLAKGVSMALGA